MGAASVKLIDEPDWQLPQTDRDLVVYSHITGVYAWWVEDNDAQARVSWLARDVAPQGLQVFVYVHMQQVRTVYDAP